MDDLGRAWKKVMLKPLGRRDKGQQQAEAQMFALLFYREVHRNLGEKAWKGIPTSPKSTTGVTKGVVTEPGSEGLPAQPTASPHMPGTVPACPCGTDSDCNTPSC